MRPITPPVTAANEARNGLFSGLGGARFASPSPKASASTPIPQENLLAILPLETRPAAIRRALVALLETAEENSLEGRRAGRFLLSLWNPGQYPLDLNDLCYFEPELNTGARHLLNFMALTGARGQELVTESAMASVIAAWGEE